MEKLKPEENFFKFYFDSSKEDEGTLKEYFDMTGIDADTSKKKLMDYLDRKEAEIRVNIGREFKRKYDKEVIKIEETAKNETEIEYKKAGRKTKGNIENDQSEEEKRKMRIVRKLKDENDSGTES
jgi:hypothetical protein